MATNSQLIIPPRIADIWVEDWLSMYAEIEFLKKRAKDLCVNLDQIDEEEQMGKYSYIYRITLSGGDEVYIISESFLDAYDKAVSIIQLDKTSCTLEEITKIGRLY
jgi:hypothetical protein